ncbi:efflux RND transporter periplasmic adaptor subunit [uncultured Thiohalocapsa sp.]|mgnify:CR=1 FL=1|uniref:efflux RND transporter periplasmic adaptor subunit n=1 Tax=uncultured Thiohalocapsa sp. TaxID=768990 RepID=UPI0025CFD9CC|nr:efflux RND transporter periplasmic adaptor subunit [uncultured Thiohalocapsa sp.]
MKDTCQRLRPAARRGLLCLLLTASTAATATQQLSGRLEWVDRVEMRAVTNGVVDEVLVTVGAHVEPGELLLRMDQREIRATLLETRARLARGIVALDDARRELDRAQELFDRGLIAMEELKDAELGHSAALAAHEADRAAVAAAEVMLERTELRAPFAGIVVERNAYDGAVIYTSLQQAPLVAVAPTDRMLARALVTAEVLRRYRPGQEAAVIIRGERRPAVVYSLGVEAVRIDPAGAVYELDVIFDARPDEILRPSEFVKVVLP